MGAPRHRPDGSRLKTPTTALPSPLPPAAPADPALLRGESPPWRLGEKVMLGALTALALVFRLYHLAADSFADDEIHKWLAAKRYLVGDFGGDDVEHPMLMKGLIALFAKVLPAHLPAELLTRLPNVLAASLCVAMLAQLGKRLLGRTAGLLAAAAYAVSVTAVGYSRFAKEDTLLTLFLLALLWCFAEAKAAADDGRVEAQRRWELWGAAALAGMFVSKYLPFLVGIPLLSYAWLRSGSRWRISWRRFLALTGVSLAVFLAFDWVLFLPGTWVYLFHYIVGDHVGDRASSESLLFMGHLYNNLAFHYWGGTPVWFHLVFAAVKLAPPTVLLIGLGGVLAARRRAPAHRIVLVWVGFFFLCFTVFGGKYGRYFIPVLPACYLLAAYAVQEATVWLQARGARPATSNIVMASLAVALVATELAATVTHAPFYRLYINALGGGDAQRDFYFPHCDYFDSGVREAVEFIAQRAEAHAEIATEVEWVVDYYAKQAGRTDLTTEPILARTACRRGHPCYVILQTGRLYWHNQEAWNRLQDLSPVKVVSIEGRPTVRVFRVEPGMPLFGTRAGGARSAPN